MGLDYVDLYLIHFPIAQKVINNLCHNMFINMFIIIDHFQFVPFEKRYPPEWSYDPDVSPKMELAKVPVHETWRAMESLVDKRMAIDIGVSNFNIQVYKYILKNFCLKCVMQIIFPGHKGHPQLCQDSTISLAGIKIIKNVISELHKNVWQLQKVSANQLT